MGVKGHGFLICNSCWLFKISRALPRARLCKGKLKVGLAAKALLVLSLPLGV